MSSFQVGATCYQTALQANQVTASAENGKVVQRGTDTYVITLGAIDDISITYVFRSTTTNALGQATTITQKFESFPQPCGLLETADSFLLAWGVATVWLIAAAINKLRQGVHE